MSGTRTTIEADGIPFFEGEARSIWSNPSGGGSGIPAGYEERELELFCAGEILRGTFLVKTNGLVSTPYDAGDSANDLRVLPEQTGLVVKYKLGLRPDQAFAIKTLTNVVIQVEDCAWNLGPVTTISGDTPSLTLSGTESVISAKINLETNDVLLVADYDTELPEGSEYILKPLYLLTWVNGEVGVLRDLRSMPELVVRA